MPTSATPVKPATAVIPYWFLLALDEIGVTEIAGQAANARITAYHATTSLGASSDEVAWCSAFVNWVMTKAGSPGTGSAAARSWLTWGRGLTVPSLACVVVLSRDAGGAGSGHVGFFIRKDAQHVWLLGGNQGNVVSIARYPLARVLGYRGHP